MTTAYPGAVDVFTTRAAQGVIASSHINDLQDAVAAVQAALGVNPKGSAATVAARIAAVEAQTPGAPTYSANRWYYTASPAANSTNAAPGNGSLRLAPWFNPAPLTVTGWALDISTAGSTGAVFRGAVYLDNGGLPGALLADLGTLDATVIAVAVGTLAQTLPAGMLWVGGVLQGAPTTQPTVRVTSTTVDPRAPALASLSATPPGASSTTSGVIQSGITGTLPATFAATGLGNAPRVLLRT